MEFFINLYNAIINLIFKLLEMNGLDTSKVPGLIVPSEPEEEGTTEAE